MPNPYQTQALTPHVLNAGDYKANQSSHTLRQDQSKTGMPWYTLLVIKSGMLAVAWEDFDLQTFEGPTALVFQPDVRYDFTPHLDCEYAWIEWGIYANELETRPSVEHALQYTNEESQPNFLNAFGCLLPDELPEIVLNDSIMLCNKVNKCWHEGGIRWQKANAMLGEWLIQVADLYSQNEDEAILNMNVDEKTALLLEIAKLQISATFSVRDWAKQAGISHNILNKRIVNELGISAREILDRIRINNVSKIFQQKDQPKTDTPPLHASDQKKQKAS